MNNKASTEQSGFVETSTSPARGPGWIEFVGLAVISLILSLVMSAFMTAFNVGFGPNYLPAAGIGTALGFVVSFPTAIVVVPLVVRWQTRQVARLSRNR